MVFYKSFFFFLFSFFFFLFLGMVKDSYYNFEIFINFFFMDTIVINPLNFNFDSFSFMFLSMVSLVTSLVVLYSDLYMEHYNIKKFFLITLMFFMFMVVLSTSGGMLNLMIGWDGLGVSSLCLIMFYSNKIGLYNSFLTFFFNRLGDLFLLFVFLYFIKFPNMNYHVGMNYEFWFLFILLICLLTKSAQIPFSSWLPAAMSAPTPISAMVHSSTLVTAGIFIFLKFNYFFYKSGLFNFLIFVSILTFLFGGFLAVIEFDLKKIVAFSTMSQISMILFFLSCMMIEISCLHTFCHALFKSLLFCFCGLMFLNKYSDQNYFLVLVNKYKIYLIKIMIFSIFSLTGLLFSCSFFTKDVVMESFLVDKEFSIFNFLILGSIFTIIYSSKIFGSGISFESFSVLSYKFNYFKFLTYFSIITLLFFKFIFELFFFNIYVIINHFFVTFLNLFLILFLFMIFKFDKFFCNLSLDIFFMKSSFFNFLFSFKKKFGFSFNFDYIIFKPSMFQFSKVYTIIIFNPMFYLIFLFLFVCLFY